MDLISLLRRLEWSKDGQCQICGARLVKADSGHKADCELKKAIQHLDYTLEPRWVCELRPDGSRVWR